MFNLLEFVKNVVLYAPFVSGIVMALVTAYGRLGIAGRWQLVSSLITGLVLGGLFWYALYAPVTFVGWFSLGLFGLITGLTASGLYEVGKELTKKGE